MMLDNHYDLYIKHLQSEYFNKIELDLLVYDEIENFKDHNDPLFMYPYSHRKSKLATFQINTDFFEFDQKTFRN